jgi:hypothetical protein
MAIALLALERYTSMMYLETDVSEILAWKYSHKLTRWLA